jgi:hypothetical protein
MKPTAVRATKTTKVHDTAAALDLFAGPSAGPFRRCDVSISRTTGGGLHIDVEVPPHLLASVGSLLAALGVKGRR